MHQLCGRGLTNSAMLRILREEHGVWSNQQAITAWKIRHGYPVRRPTKERLQLIPWRVKLSDSTHYTLSRLRSTARARAGGKLSKPSAGSWSAFREEMEENPGLVVHYDRVNGWVLVPRRDGIDNDYIRDPRYADDGSEIDAPELWQ